MSHLSILSILRVFPEPGEPQSTVLKLFLLKSSGDTTNPSDHRTPVTRFTLRGFGSTTLRVRIQWWWRNFTLGSRTSYYNPPKALPLQCLVYSVVLSWTMWFPEPNLLNYLHVPTHRRRRAFPRPTHHPRVTSVTRLSNYRVLVPSRPVSDTIGAVP